MNVNEWVDDRLAALDDGKEWQPDAAAARGRLRIWERQTRTRRRWAWVSAAAACLGLLAFVQPRACANPRGCFQGAAAQKTAPQPAVIAVPAPVPLAAPAKAPITVSTAKPQKAAPIPAPTTVRNYKESGSPDAPIGCEIYSDYECPSCALFFRDTLPRLVADYVQTGKVKLLHRDFPLPQHTYAKPAARYANAAGQAGQYDVVVNRLFETQAIWGANGEIEAQLAPVLLPAVMRRVRDMVEHDQQLDDTMAADLAMGVSDRISSTPTLVVVWKGKRQAVSAMLSYTLLKSYLDDLLTR
jgi:protein-disulfide isomerase